MDEEYDIGIDLGTTYSCLAYIGDDGTPIVSKNYEQDDTTPSVILFNDVGETLVGTPAKDLMLMYPSDRFVLDIKRKIGQDYSLDIDGRIFTPASLSALILKKLIKDFENNRGLDEGTVKKAVITVPAYFGYTEREATVNAGRIAGLDEVTIINEPTAAAICFGYANNAGGPKKVLVYDLGGGTFDVTVLEIDGKHFNAIATDGKRLLGGKDWDEALKHIIITKISEMSGLSESELEADSDIMDRLIQESEDMKKRLSTSESTRGTMNVGGRKVIYTVTRKEFEEATRDLIESTVDVVQKVLDEHGLKLSELDSFLLVGGSSKMPQVHSAIAERFPEANVKLFDPDQSVAKGAAIYSRSQSLLEDISDGVKLRTKVGDAPADIAEVSKAVDEAAANVKNAIVVHNVLSKTFGIKVSDESGNDYVSNIVFRDVTLPIVDNKTFYPFVDGQPSIEVDIYENNAYKNDDGLRVDILDSNLVGSFPMQLPDDVTKNTPINVRFSVGNDGMLSAYVECKNEHTEYQLKTKTFMNEEEIRNCRRLIERDLS